MLRKTVLITNVCEKMLIYFAFPDYLVSDESVFYFHFSYNGFHLFKTLGCEFDGETSRLVTEINV